MNPPVFDIDPVSFKADPYPVYTKMRAEAPICYVPQLDAVLLTKRDDIFTCEKNTAVFSSEQPGGLMTVLMGENMMRKDGEDHMRERRMIFPAVSPKTVTAVWRKQFEDQADRILDEIADHDCVDIVADYSTRLSGEAMKIMTGLQDAAWNDIDRWSQAMIDGISNYAGDREVELRCRQATSDIDQRISSRMDALKESPDQSMISVLMTAGLEKAGIQANIKLAISGGQNEPRDAIAGCVWDLLSHPQQVAKLKSGDAGWMQVFDEYCRWIAPIGMSPRRIAARHCYDGITFEPEQRAFLMFGSANRDEACFENPDIFDIDRDTSKSIAFGAGPHFCAGAWASRCLVAEVALPKLFERFPRMQVADAKACVFEGWGFRGLKKLPVSLSG